MLKIRLMRIGAKKRPFYRVVVIDERSKRSGEYIELLGTYNPLTNPHEINLKQDRIDHWTKQGAQMSDGFLRIIGKAPQRPARKTKKVKQSLPSNEGKQVTGDSGQVKPEETPAVQQVSESADQPISAEVAETPVETAQSEASAETVIPSENEESLANASQNESGDSSPSVQNDKVEEEKKDEGSA